MTQDPDTSETATVIVTPPAWFKDVIALAPEVSRITVAGAGVELLTWGEVGKPGLLFLHGLSAHARWWSFIAPFFAKDYRCAAVTWSGMGLSDWRESYLADMYVEEIFAAISAARLDAAPTKPVVIAHSLGGMSAVRCAEMPHTPMRAAIIIDRGFYPPGHSWRPPVARGTPFRRYDNFEEAVSRFRLTPAQPCDNHFLVDYVARNSLRHLTTDGKDQWVWAMDPELRKKMNLRDQLQQIGTPQCPMAFVWGENSRVYHREGMAEYVRSRMPEAPWVVIPNSGHHVMLDQPLALVAALRALLEGWAR